MEQADDLIQRSARLLDQTHKLVERTQVMLAQLQSFHEALEQLRSELTTHDQQLLEAVNQLRKQSDQPGPRPSSAFMEPVASPFPWEVAQEKEPDPTNFPAEPTPAPNQFAPERPERRLAVRRGGNLVSIVLRRDAEQAKTSSGWVLDRSLGGLGLLVEEAAQANETLMIRPATAEAGEWVEVEVRYCQPLGSSWRLGCRFVGQLAWEQLRLFG